ncbi:MAG: glucan biosynthesis protein [Rhodomicrobium sp.]|nr:glucan biosynthesis protein [Rhodomicrobium sp.]
MDRRTWLKLAASTAAAAAFPRPALPQGSPANPQPFSEDLLDAIARRRADEPYNAPAKRVDDALAGLTYEQYSRAIVYKEDQAIWRKDGVPFWLEPYHTAGSFYAYPVEIFSVEAGQAVKIPYSAPAFEFNPPAKQPATPAQSDFAGFHALAQIDKPGVFRDFLSFLGATNFRAIASGQVFGVSARALAINTGQPGGEDFPLFRSLWIERPKPIDQSLVVHGLADSVSAVARFKFTVKPGYTTVIDTEAVIYPRRRIGYAGIAPIASRFFFGPGVPPKRRDYRPRAHDSEALYIMNGAGEQIWRPLLNPERLQFSVFLDKGPKGFGLVQRERSFSSYQDNGLQYERRPSLWIEPLGDWGEGSIDLIELPAPEEINENIVCFWRPKDGLGPGIGHRFQYRMHWCWNPPFENKKAAVMQTRVGEGKSGDVQFIVDFSNTEACDGCGGTLSANVTASAGEVRNVRLAAVPAAGAGVQRLRFGYAPSGGDPVDLRAQLLAGGKPISDTWIFRWTR